MVEDNLASSTKFIAYFQGRPKLTQKKLKWRLTFILIYAIAKTKITLLRECESNHKEISQNSILFLTSDEKLKSTEALEISISEGSLSKFAAN